MASLETERFLAIMGRHFRHYVDEIYGPFLGPGGPRMRLGGRLSPDPEPWFSPNPEPWRELGVAVEVTRLAEAFELASEGTGATFLRRFADDPDDWCGTRPPGWPRPKDEGLLDSAVLGAALDFVAGGMSNGDLAATAHDLGQNMIR
jgi:hypothetical protein